MEHRSRFFRAGMWARILLAWLVLAVVVSLNGVLRELILRRAFGPRIAAVLSVALEILLVLVTTRFFFPPLVGVGATTLLRVSVVLLLLTIAFETSLGVLVDHKSWHDLLAHYALWRGELWPIVLALLALTPFRWGRWWPTG